MSRNGGSTAMQAPLPMSPTGRALVAAMVTASSVGAGSSRVDRDGRTTPAASVDSDDDDDDMESQHPFIVLGTRTNTLAARTPSPPPSAGARRHRDGRGAVAKPQGDGADAVDHARGQLFVTRDTSRLSQKHTRGTTTGTSMDSKNAARNGQYTNKK